MKINQTIEFAPTSGFGKQTAPWERNAPTDFKDLVFKDEFKNRKLVLENGPNWLRVVPALLESNHWMLNVPTISIKGGRFAHPRTIQRGGVSPFDLAYRWLAANSPEKLFNSKNPGGYQLLCKSLCAFWCLKESGSGIEARLFLGSSYDGSGKGEPGLGYRIWQKLSKPDGDVDVIMEPLHPVRGTMLCIEKIQPPGVRYPTYSIRSGRKAAPIQELLDRMEPMEFDLLRPIERTIREVGEEEQWQHLEAIVGDATTGDIRSASC